MNPHILLLLLLAGVTDTVVHPWIYHTYNKYNAIHLSPPGGVCFVNGVFASKSEIETVCSETAKKILNGTNQEYNSSLCTFPRLDLAVQTTCAHYCLDLVDDACNFKHCPDVPECPIQRADHEPNHEPDAVLDCEYEYMRDECGPRCEQDVKKCELDPGPGTSPTLDTSPALETTSTLATSRGSETAPGSETSPGPESSSMSETSPTPATSPVSESGFVSPPTKGLESTESGKELKTTEGSKNIGNNLKSPSIWIATMFLSELIFA